VYELFDPQLEALTELLTRSGRGGNPARDFEAGVAWLAWLRGFSVAHLGGTTRTQEAPDLIGTTPLGHFVVTECTTGLLKAENKLARLVQRAVAVRERLNSSNNHHLRVLPLIVTALPRNEVKAELAPALSLGVAVMAREDLLDAVRGTILPPDADRIFVEAEQALQLVRTGAGAVGPTAPVN
jgi:hypothetical protein